MEDFRKELAEVKDVLTQIRICMAKLEASQNSFKEALALFREERLKTYDIMTHKIEEVEKEVQRLDKKMTYASGIVAAVATFLSVTIGTITKKLGLA